MGYTHFTGPVVSFAGFVTGETDATSGVYGGAGNATTPLDLGSTADQKMIANYATTSAASGDTRLTYDKLIFTAAGSGETLRAFSVVSGATAAVGGTVNGAHISLEIDGASGAVSGAGNALRATLGGTATTPGGTLSALQVDSNFAAGVTLPAATSFIRVTNTNTTTIPNLLNIPAPANGSIFATHTTQVMTHSIRIISGGTNYYIMCTTATTNRG